MLGARFYAVSDLLVCNPTLYFSLCLSLHPGPQLGDMYEAIRWPATLGFFTVLLLLCSILVIGVARSSRCALIFFSVFGLFGVIVCWLLSGIYLAGAVAMGDFCMRPLDYMCRQFGKVSTWLRWSWETTEFRTLQIQIEILCTCEMGASSHSVHGSLAFVQEGARMK